MIIGQVHQNVDGGALGQQSISRLKRGLERALPSWPNKSTPSAPTRGAFPAARPVDPWLTPPYVNGENKRANDKISIVHIDELSKKAGARDIEAQIPHPALHARRLQSDPVFLSVF